MGVTPLQLTVGSAILLSLFFIVYGAITSPKDKPEEPVSSLTKVKFEKITKELYKKGARANLPKILKREGVTPEDWQVAYRQFVKPDWMSEAMEKRQKKFAQGNRKTTQRLPWIPTAPQSAPAPLPAPM